MSFIAKFQAQPSCKDMVAPEKNQLHINYNALLAVRYKAMTEPSIDLYCSLPFQTPPKFYTMDKNN